jgi:Zn-dependent M28 family amino/carboxypeptidase
VQSTGVRWAALKSAGAIGTISIQNPKNMDIPWERATLSRLQPQMILADARLGDTEGQRLSLTANPAHADKLLAGSGHTLARLLELADAGASLPRFDLKPSLRVRARTERGEVESDNVAGVWRGTDRELSNEYVVLSAHLDHLGVGTPINNDTIFNGAMDNASGIATLLEIAARLSEGKRRFRRSVVFLAVTGEEKGLLGSRYFAESPTVRGTIIANLNFDMFLPLFPMKIVMALGVDESDLGDRLRQVAAPRGVTVQSDPEPLRNRFTRSDQYNFIRRGVPALAFKIGYEAKSPEAEIAARWTKERYHAPSDDLGQPVDLKAADDFNGLMAELLAAIADGAKPHWKDSSFFKRFAVPSAE